MDGISFRRQYSRMLPSRLIDAVVCLLTWIPASLIPVCGDAELERLKRIFWGTNLLNSSICIGFWLLTRIISPLPLFAGW